MSDSISLRGQAAVFDPVADGPVAITGSIVENTATVSFPSTAPNLNPFSVEVLIKIKV